MPCRDRSLPGKILPWPEFDREVPCLRYSRTIRPAKTRPVLNRRSAGRVRSEPERDGERGHEVNTKHPIQNTKHQTPNTKEIPIPKLQFSSRRRHLGA